MGLNLYLKPAFKDSETVLAHLFVVHETLCNLIEQDDVAWQSIRSQISLLKKREKTDKSVSVKSFDLGVCERILNRMNLGLGRIDYLFLIQVLHTLDKVFKDIFLIGLHNKHSRMAPDFAHGTFYQFNSPPRLQSQPVFG